jgi:hypothetical protein
MEQQLKQQARQVWYIRLMLAIYLAATTGYLFYTATANFSPILRIFITGVSVIVIDAFNGRLMDASLLGFGKSEKSIAYRQALGVWAFVILTLLAHARFFATTTLTYFSRTPMAAAIVGEVQGDAEINAIETAQGERAARTAKLEAEKNRIANSEARRIREARRQGQSLIDAAINSKGEEVARLYRSGESKWVMSDRKFRAYRDGIRKAREEAARLEAEARMETKAASEAFIASTAQDTAYLSTLNRILENKVARNEQLTGVYNFTLGFLDIAFGVLYWFLSLFLAQFKRKHDIEYESPFAGVFAKISDRITDDMLQGTESGAMGLWRGVKLFPAIFIKLWGFFTALAWKGVYALERQWRIDLDGDGQIGTPDKKATTEKSDNVSQNFSDKPAANSRVVVAPFALNKKSDKSATDLQNVAFVSQDVARSENIAFVSQIGEATNEPEKERQIKRQTIPQKKRQKATNRNKTPAQMYIDRMRVTIKRHLKAGNKPAAQALVDELKMKGYQVDIEPGKGLTIKTKPKK